MLIYSVFVLLLLCTIFFVHSKDKEQLHVIFISAFLVFFLTGTRWEYGGDWDNYLSYFQNIKELSFDDVSMEPGWVLLSYIIKITTDSYVLFQFVIAGIIFFCIFKSIKHLSVAPILSYFVFFAVENGAINYVRTAVATCIIIYSYIYVSERKLLKFLVTIGLACSIHFSAFLAFPLYWIYKMKIAYPKYILIGICFMAFFYVAGKLFLSDFSLFGSYIQYKLDKYITGQEAGDSFGAMVTVETAMLNHIIKKSFIFVFLLLFCRKALVENLVFRGLTNIYVAGTIFYCSVVPIALQFARTSGYYDGVEMFICAYIYKTINKKEMRLLFLILVIIMNFIRLKGHLDPANPLIYNYHNVLFL